MKMQILKSCLESNYRQHSAFNFGVSSWDTPREKLAIFNDTYAAARKFGCALTESGKAQLQQDLQNAMGDVFAFFRLQAVDNYEQRFLLELESACNRLLREELDWYAKRSLCGIADLSIKSVRHDAICMQAERHYFGCLPLSAVSQIRNLGNRELERFRANASEGLLKREDLSVNSGPIVRDITKLLNREFQALGVLDVVSAYSGRKIRVTGVAFELSVPQATWWKNAIGGLDRPPNTLYAHLDETISCPKAIVYLSDVTEQNGPTGCYPDAYDAMQLNPLQELIGRVVGTVGTTDDSPLKAYYAKQYHQSVNSESFRRHFMRLPECLRFNSHLGWDVAPGSELESSLAANERKMTGSAGTFIVFDGARLLHRGGLMQQGERLALQVIFSDLTFTDRAVAKLKGLFS